MKLPIPKTLLGSEVRARFNVPQRRLTYLAQIGAIPGAETQPGQGMRRQYNYAQVLHVVLVNILMDVGVSVSVAKNLASFVPTFLRANEIEEPDRRSDPPFLVRLLESTEPELKLLDGQAVLFAKRKPRQREKEEDALERILFTQRMIRAAQTEDTEWFKKNIPTEAWPVLTFTPDGSGIYDKEPDSQIQEGATVIVTIKLTNLLRKIIEAFRE